MTELDKIRGFNYTVKMKKYLTHKDIEHLCDGFMFDRGWTRVNLSEISIQPRILMDRLYLREEEEPLGFEIKPENILDEEVKRGIGQLCCITPFKIKPYLVIPHAKFEVFNFIIALQPWLGVITYDSFGHLETQKKPTHGLIPLDLPMPPKPLTEEFLRRALNELQLADFCTASVLTDKLRVRFPGYKYSSRYIGALLTKMGFTKTEGGYIMGSLDNFEKEEGGTHSNSSIRSPVPTPRICPECGGKLKLIFRKRGGKTNVFSGCSNYPGCSYTQPRINEK